MQKSELDPEQKISASFAAQGLMTTLGAELVHISRGEVHIALRPRPEISQQHGYTHAGAVTSIADSACGYSALSVAPAECDVLTVEFKINFIRPAVGERFLAIGKVVKRGKTLTVCQSEVVAEQGAKRATIAVMQATIMNIAGAQHRDA